MNELSFFDALWMILRSKGEVLFFVYLWIIVMFVAAFWNNLTPKRARFATFYVGVSLVLLELARYNYRVIVTGSVYSNIPTALEFLMFIALVGGIWSAVALDEYAKKQKGWLFKQLSGKVRRLSDYLGDLADKKDPINRMAKLIEKSKENE